MGSGLILLLIVGAWLAVLVPMALRSHDAAAALGTVDRFHDAMRVLSRRNVRRPAAAAVAAPASAAPRPGPTPAARRRRALGGLVLVSALTLAGGLLGPVWLLVPHVLADLLLLAFLAWLRNAAVARAEREWRVAMGDRHPAGQRDEAWSPLQEWSAEADSGPRVPEQPGPEQPVPAHVVPEPSVPVRVPAQASGPDVFDQESLDVPAAEPARVGRVRGPRAVPDLTTSPAPPARGAQGAPWQPVPVPVPTYVTAARAPRRVVDLARPRPSAEALAATERPLGTSAPGAELEHVLGRRAVGG